MDYTCTQCGKTFANEFTRRRHMKLHVDNVALECNFCGKKINRKDNFNRHVKTCEKKTKCCHCEKYFNTAIQRRIHMREAHRDKLLTCEGCGKDYLCEKEHRARCRKYQNDPEPSHKFAEIETENNQNVPERSHRFAETENEDDQNVPGPSHRSAENHNAEPIERYTCRTCHRRFDSRRTLFIHQMNEHFQVGEGGLQARPWGNGTPPWEEGGRVDHRLKEVYESNIPIILRRHQEGTVCSVYNFPIDNQFSVGEIMQAANEIYDRQNRAFRLNLEFGLILIHTETNEYRYFKPYHNQEVFQRPIYVSQRNHLNRLQQRMQRFNITDYILRQRPDTKWKPYLITNVRIVIYHLNFVLGNAAIILPPHISQSKSIVKLTNDRRGQTYTDNLCAFRCLAVHQGYYPTGLDSRTNVLFQQWVLFQKAHQKEVNSNPKTFPGITLNEIIYFEKCFKTNVNVFSLNESQSAQSIYKSSCKFSDTMHLNLYEHHLSYISNFNSYAQKFLCKTCRRHFRYLTNMKRHQRVCTGKTKRKFQGGFHYSPSTVFDKLEQFGVSVPENERIYEWFLVYDFESMLVPMNVQSSCNHQYTENHVPISVSICSNVDGYTEPHCIIEPDINALVKNMLECMTTIASRAAEIAKAKFAHVFEALDGLVFDVNVNDDMAEYLEYENDVKKMIDEEKKYIEKLKLEMEEYCEQIICIGFNSAKYDINLIKSYLIKHLQLDSSKSTFTVKRNNSYACISTATFKFLDITQYLSPGINYSKFLRAFDVQESKGFFPYQFLDSVEKLNYPELPPHECFYSSLKCSNITNEEYAFCQKVWEENDMTSFRDFLVWYNNLDVKPFVQAVQNLQKYYFERRIDIFKCSISVPGLARRMLFDSGRKEGASFALIDQANEDLYDTIKQNVIGGPSIIFNRYHEVGKTYIRGNSEKPCGKIIGFDANALYLYCIGKKMPVGSFVRRRVESGFKPQKRDRYSLAYDWLEWLNHSGQYMITHKLNSGKEKKIGRYPVDGYVEASNTVFQFQGCYWHGHRCWLTRHVQDDKLMTSRERRTRKTTLYLQKKGYRIVEMRECIFRNNIRSNLRLKKFTDSRKPNINQGHLSPEEVIEAVMSDKLFGMVECDIRVPDTWPAHFSHPTMTPYEYFSEMSPLFCTSDIPFDAIGSHMQHHAKVFHLSTKPRRLLVGGMRARQLLIATPLLKWYISHGLEITKIYQTVEYTSQRCFQSFVSDVSKARRQGDADPTKAIVADTRKLEGNSAFGSTIMDQEKFQIVKYVRGEGNAMMEINEPRFKKLTTLIEDEELFEIERSKKILNLNLPIQIGYFILHYAKLHMLQFYYDFMVRYVNRADFEYCEMDTDSAYMAISGPNFESVIKSDMRQAYNHSLKGHCIVGLEIEADCDRHWFPRTCCEEHAMYDRRTPGLFKIEFEGDEIIGLCSKTYIVSARKQRGQSSALIAAKRLVERAKKCRSRKSRHIQQRLVTQLKFSCKGVSKKRVKAPLTTFRNVLKTQKQAFGINMGFKLHNNQICTYRQVRNGFSYFYCKRKVLADGVSTEPLDIELCPMKPKSDHEIAIDDFDLNLIHLLAEVE